jgi:hypothetical protein
MARDGEFFFWFSLSSLLLLLDSMSMGTMYCRDHSLLFVALARYQNVLLGLGDLFAFFDSL